MTPIETKLRELEEALKVEGICSECGFEVNFRHRRGCKIEYLSVNITDEVPNLIAALREAVDTLVELRASAMRMYGTEKEINKLTSPGRGDAALVLRAMANIEKILGEQK